MKLELRFLSITIAFLLGLFSSAQHVIDSIHVSFNEEGHVKFGNAGKILHQTNEYTLVLNESGRRNPKYVSRINHEDGAIAWQVNLEEEKYRRKKFYPLSIEVISNDLYFFYDVYLSRDDSTYVLAQKLSHDGKLGPLFRLSGIHNEDRINDPIKVFVSQNKDFIVTVGESEYEDENDPTKLFIHKYDLDFNLLESATVNMNIENSLFRRAETVVDDQCQVLFIGITLSEESDEPFFNFGRSSAEIAQDGIGLYKLSSNSVSINRLVLPFKENSIITEISLKYHNGVCLITSLPSLDDGEEFSYFQMHKVDVANMQIEGSISDESSEIVSMMKSKYWFASFNRHRISFIDFYINSDSSITIILQKRTEVRFQTGVLDHIKDIVVLNVNPNLDVNWIRHLPIDVLADVSGPIESTVIHSNDLTYIFFPDDEENRDYYLGIEDDLKKSDTRWDYVSLFSLTTSGDVYYSRICEGETEDGLEYRPWGKVLNYLRTMVR